MNTLHSRRNFLGMSATATGVVLVPSLLRAAGSTAPSAAKFSFVLLGDLHFDKLEHHDFTWLDKTHPNDLNQIKNYSRITAEVMPKLFATVRETVTELNRSPATRVAFVLQAGDLVEGLCGTEELALRQNSEAVTFIRDAKLGAPFLFTKGNHDVTGDGARDAFAKVFHPFLSGEAAAVAPGTSAESNAFFSVESGNAQFAFFDAYQTAASLEWFEAVAAKRTAEHLFVVVHPPVVPYGARATWHVFANDKDKAKRDKFLELLGRQHAFVLGGHIHKYNTLARAAGGGRFAQFALSSVISGPDVVAKTPLSGLADYTGDQIKVEPKFSPDTEQVRRAMYTAEKPFVKAFEYADLPGYAVVTVDGPRVTAQMYTGFSRQVWRTVDLTGLLGRTV